MDDLAIEVFLRQQGLTPEQIERAKRLVEQTSLDPAEAAFAVCLADGETEGDVVRTPVDAPNQTEVTARP
jgi:hypothetical protein